MPEKIGIFLQGVLITVRKLTCILPTLFSMTEHSVEIDKLSSKHTFFKLYLISWLDNQLLHSEVVSNQVGCSCAWQRSLSCETNTGATEDVPAPNQSWRGCDHPTSNWPYQGHQIPYLVPRTADWLPPLWSNTHHWPYAAGACIVTGMSWWILHSRLVECSLQDNSWDLHSGIPARSGILLPDMM